MSPATNLDTLHRHYQLVNTAKVDEKDHGNDEEAVREDAMGDLKVLCVLPPLGLSILP